MSALKFRMKKADKALWMDMKFHKNKGLAEGKKHRRYREVVQSCIPHSSESWSLNKGMVDTLHGWDSRNLDLMSSRRWAQTGLSSEWFQANQIRKARKRFADGGGEKHCLFGAAKNLELQGENIRQQEEQTIGQNDEKHSDPCES